MFTTTINAVCLAATDPANPYGAALPWPSELSGRPERSPGARVVLANGKLIAFISRSGKAMNTQLSEDEVIRRKELQALASALGALIERDLQRTIFFETIDGESAHKWPQVSGLTEHGFRSSSSGLLLSKKTHLEAMHARR